MSAPRPKGSRLCVIHGNSLADGADPVEGKRVTVDAGGYPGARERGTLRTEGRDYVVQDGDVITIRH